jgi:hypothetical protein
MRAETPKALDLRKTRLVLYNPFVISDIKEFQELDVIESRVGRVGNILIG